MNLKVLLLRATVRLHAILPGNPTRTFFYINTKCQDGRFNIVSTSTTLLVVKTWDRIPVRAIFPAPVQTVSGAYPASYAVSTGSFQGTKRPGPGVNH